jgi:adenosine deaminase
MSDGHTPTPDLTALPKAELHVHLEGSVRPATLEEFAARSGATIPRGFTTLAGFIDSYMVAWGTMTQPGDYARMVREYVDDAVRAGVRYAELQLATAYRPFDCIAEASGAAERERDVELRFIVDVPRAMPVEVGWAMLEAAKGHPRVVALGVAGLEDGYPAAPFCDLVREARARGLHSAPHAAETTGPEHVREAMDMLMAERIQHGIGAARDPALLADLAERRLPLAVCPTSNLLLGAVASLEAHPLRALWDAGILVSVNTDDPGFFGCDLTGEYALAGRLLGLDRAGYARLARNSVESSFAPEGLRTTMLASIVEWERGAD